MAPELAALRHSCDRISVWRKRALHGLLPTDFQAGTGPTPGAEMESFRMTYRTSVALFAVLVAIGATALAQQPSAAPTPPAEKQKMIQLGIEQKTAAGLYKYLKQKANGGQPLTWKT